MKEKVLALAEELDGVSFKENCDQCLACGTALCRGDIECAESAHKACAKRLREIVERDECEATTMSAYDLLPDDDRKAIAWVREHGGLDAVKASAHQGAREHGCLLKIAEMLGTSIYDGTDNADALLDKLEKRLMPEGREWPRYEDGEPVRLGEHWEEDGFDESVTRIDSIEFADDGVRFENEYNEVFCRYGARVKRPAPKVLDADGKEIRVGDTVWDVESGIEYEVVGIHTDEDSPVRVMRTDGSHLAKATKSDMLTNQRPVLDADGVPIKKGDTVWHKATDAKYRVFRFSAVENCVWGESDLGCFLLDCSMLTHEQPDSWERLEEDARMEAFDYVAQRKPEVGEFTSISTDKCIDLVRRAKKLAGDA